MEDFDFYMKINGLIRVTAHGALNLRECSWGPLRKLKLMTVAELPQDYHPEGLFYAESLDKLYQELHSSHPPVLGLTYCCYATVL